ncbi:MAG: triose-phosphate isomerase [Bacteroidota bacterium]
MRTKIAAGNWKMNKNLDEGIALAQAIAESFSGDENKKTILCTPFLHLTEVKKIISAIPHIHLGAQNCSSENAGAFTGEISAGMLASAGVEYVICGHSERRAQYFETDGILTKKVDRILENKMKVIFCCGELLAERKIDIHFNVVESQLINGLFHLSAEAMKNVVIAYEPVWAIGTGVTATTAEAQEMHFFIRGLLKTKYGEDIASATTILYGGSCNATNAAELFSQPDVDGGLVGGASLKADDFLKIIQAL